MMGDGAGGDEGRKLGAPRTCPSVLRMTCAYTKRLLKKSFSWCIRSPIARVRVTLDAIVFRGAPRQVAA